MSNIVDKLLETASALNEDAYARHMDRKVEQLRKDHEREQKRVDHGKDPSRLKELESTKVKVTSVHNGKYDGDWTEIKPTNDSDYRHYKNARTGHAGIETGWSSSYVTRKDRGNATIRRPVEERNYHTHDEVDAYAKRKGISRDEASKAMKKQDALNDRINSNTKKDEAKNPSHKSTQHESAAKLAELLVEAAGLLMESSGGNGLAKRMADKGMLTPQASENIDRLDKYKKAVTMEIAKQKKIDSDLEKYKKAAEQQKAKGNWSSERQEKYDNIISKAEQARERTEDAKEFARQRTREYRGAIEDELKSI